MSTILPSFKKPPVVETALSAQFKPIDGMRNAHIGLFWGQVKDRFSIITDERPIAPRFERFETASASRLPRFELAESTTDYRALMTVSDGSRMLQIQHDRLVFNWKKTEGQEYPRWNAVFPEFNQLLDLFIQFLNQQNLPAPEFNQWEAAYVNQCPKGVDWNDPSEWNNVYPGLMGVSPLNGPALESFKHNFRYRLPENAGRLYAEFFHAVTTETPHHEVLVLRLTCRGTPVPADKNGILKGLETARMNIVTAFTELSSKSAHFRWERET